MSENKKELMENSEKDDCKITFKPKKKKPLRQRLKTEEDDDEVDESDSAL